MSQNYSDIRFIQKSDKRVMTDGGTPQWQPRRQRRRSVSHWILLGFLLSVFTVFAIVLLLASMGATV